MMISPWELCLSILEGIGQSNISKFDFRGVFLMANCSFSINICYSKWPLQNLYVRVYPNA